MKIKYILIPLMLLVFINLSGCATDSNTGFTPAHDTMDATLWVQTSAEYAALTTSVYATATVALIRIAEANANAVGEMSVVFDIDETVLDNSRYQGQLVTDNVGYDSDSWDRWVAMRSASAVPGAVEFIQMSQSLGFHVVFITNRKCKVRPDTPVACPQKQETLTNLQAVGVNTESTTLFLRGEQPSRLCRAFLSVEELTDGIWSSEKTSRRKCAELNHQSILLFGDQLGDFTHIEKRSTYGSGHDLAQRFNSNWGKTWFMLPNPTYGEWRPFENDQKRSLLRGID